MDAVRAVWIFLTLAILFLAQIKAENEFVIRWCVVNSAEKMKCELLQGNLKLISQQNNAIAAKVKKYELICQERKDIFDCMNNIQKNNVDLITLDPGQGFYASKYHNMRPIMAEMYNTDFDRLKFYAVAVINSASNIDINSMQNKKVCFPGIGNGAGWIYPISALIDKNLLKIIECNAIVRTVSAFFSGTCLPGGLSAFYNQLGNNPNKICELCDGYGDDHCTTSDPYAGYDGAFRCLERGIGDIAFVRDNTVALMLQNNTGAMSNFKLLCPFGSHMPLDQYKSCNWGKIPSHVIMASGTKTAKEIQPLKDFLILIDELFGVNGRFKNKFFLYNSNSVPMHGRMNLLFTDGTIGLEDLGKKDSDYTWIGADFHKKLSSLNRCPLRTARWCVISIAEKTKCEDMLMALRAKNIKPDLDCILAENAIGCMKLIASGDADIVNLDAGDIYTAGKMFGHVPIAAEDYGDMSKSFHVVAVAKKTESRMTLFNMKQKRACHAGVGRGDGWIIPLGVYIDTEQFIPHDCSAFRNIGELFVRACIPGALDKEYNADGFPVNLCEGCGAEGFRKCLRNSEEQYYGANGAFRCLVESGGDVAFVRHLTPRDNTDGRNHAMWARNRRSDDYELLCKDGHRTNIDNWEQCHLGKVPANAIVTASYKSEAEREIFWNMLNYGQQFFSSDIAGDFHMFDSGTYYTDLIFTDAAVRLMYIPPEEQNYIDYLGADFISQVESLQQYTCMPVDASSYLQVSFMLLIFSLAVLVFL